MSSLQHCAWVDTKGYFGFRGDAAKRPQSHKRINTKPAQLKEALRGPRMWQNFVLMSQLD
jgi:hypothetical protein